MTALVVSVLRILVAGIFLLYGLEKMLNSSILRETLSRYIPGVAVPVASTALAAGEVVIGILFLFGLSTTMAGIVILAMVVVFSAVLIDAWRAGSGKSDCGCSRSPMPVRVAVLRNALLFIATLCVVLLPVAKPSSALLLFEAGVGALIVGGTLLLARRQPVTRSVSAIQEMGSMKVAAQERRRALGVLGKGVAGVLGLGFLLVAGSGQAFAASLAPNVPHPPCDRVCSVYGLWVCNCGVLDKYLVQNYYFPDCSVFCYSVATFLYWIGEC